MLFLVTYYFDQLLITKELKNINNTLTSAHMKRARLIYFLFSAFFLSAVQLSAQLPCEDLALPQEQVRLHLDRNICLAGETIWFKAWCFLDGQLGRDLSKVLYVEIFDETQKVIVQEKYLLNNNSAIGSFRIPEDVPSKYYFLKAYTRYMRNFSSTDFHYQQVTIINPLIEGDSIQVKDTKAGINQTHAHTQQYADTASENLFQIALKEDEFQPRQQIDFHINTNKPITAEVSMVVRLQGLGNQPSEEVLVQNPWMFASCLEDPFCKQAYTMDNQLLAPSNGGEPNNKLNQNISELQWLPETRGLTISGLVQNKRKEKVAGALSMVAVIQKEPLLYMGTTNEHGVFTICLHHLHGQKDLYIGSPIGKNNVLVRSGFDPEFPDITTVPIQFDSSFHHLLESLNLHQQLKRAYPKNVTQPTFQADRLNVVPTNILASDYRITLSDYIKVSSMTEVFEELTAGVILRKKNGIDYLSIFNAKEQKHYDSPLVLLDNVPVFNISELLKIDPVKIEAIEVYNTDYILGDYILNGIISIISKTDDFASYKWGEQRAFVKFKTFASIAPFEQVLHLEKSHLPDFRPVLYWQPTLQIKPKKTSDPISFFAPDRPGIYEILIQGFTELGEACFGYITFEVVLNR